MKKTNEYDKFSELMTELIKVPHSEIKAKLDAEKRAKNLSDQEARDGK